MLAVIGPISDVCLAGSTSTVGHKTYIQLAYSTFKIQRFKIQDTFICCRKTNEHIKGTKNDPHPYLNNDATPKTSSLQYIPKENNLTRNTITLKYTQNNNISLHHNK